MKCLAIVVVLSVVAAEDSMYGSWPYGAPPGGYYGAWPTAYFGHPGIATYSSFAPAGHWTGPGAVHVAATAYPQVLTKGATYTAKTRGAVHIAPLPGHALSQTSLNVAPAPGTW